MKKCGKKDTEEPGPYMKKGCNRDVSKGTFQTDARRFLVVNANI